MAEKKETAESVTTSAPAPRFAVDQLLTSKQFSGVEKDVMRAVLAADQEYSLDEARAAIKAFAESEVQ